MSVNLVRSFVLGRLFGFGNAERKGNSLEIFDMDPSQRSKELWNFTNALEFKL